jgi:hypothetical protein
MPLRCGIETDTIKGDFLKLQRLRRAQESKPQFTGVNEDFDDKPNEEIWSF